MLSGMAVIGVGMFVVLAASNRKLRNASLSSALTLALQEMDPSKDEGVK